MPSLGEGRYLYKNVNIENSMIADQYENGCEGDCDRGVWSNWRRKRVGKCQGWQMWISNASKISKNQKSRRKKRPQI